MARKLIKTTPRMGYKGMAKVVQEANQKFKEAIHSETTPVQEMQEEINISIGDIFEDLTKNNRQVEVIRLSSDDLQKARVKPLFLTPSDTYPEYWQEIKNLKLVITAKDREFKMLINSIKEKINEKDNAEDTLFSKWQLKEHKKKMDAFLVKNPEYKKAHDLANEAEKEFREINKDIKSEIVKQDDFEIDKNYVMLTSLYAQYFYPSQINSFSEMLIKKYKSKTKMLLYQHQLDTPEKIINYLFESGYIDGQGKQTLLAELGKSELQEYFKVYPKLNKEFENQKDTTMFTITKKKHDKTGKDIWVAKLINKIDYAEFKNIEKQVKELGGYYSKFVKGFVFNEDPQESLKSISADAPSATTTESTPKRPNLQKKLDFEKLYKASKKPRKDVIIDEIKAGKMEFAVHKSFNGMTDGYDYNTVTNESFSPAESAIRKYHNDDNSNYLIDDLESAKGQSHWVYSASIGHKDDLGYYINFSDYYIRYKENAAKSLTQSRSALIPKKEPEAKPIDEITAEDIFDGVKVLPEKKEPEAPEQITGGLADGTTIEDIAEKHGKDLGWMKEQWNKGTLIEAEHTSDINKAGEIALDHLAESPNYYIELEKMEKKLEDNKEIFDEKFRVRKIENRKYQVYNDERIITHNVSGEYFDYFTSEDEANRIAERLNNVNQSRSEFMDELHPLDLWVLFTDNRYYRKFEFKPDLSNEKFDEYFREIADRGVKERITETQKNGITSLIISVKTESEADEISDLYMKLFPVEGMILNTDEQEEINEDELVSKAFKDKISDEPISQEIVLHPDIKGRSNTYGYSFKVERITFDKSKNEGKVFIFGEYDRYGGHRKNIFYLKFYLLDGKIIFSGIDYQDRIGILTAESKNILVEELESEHLSKGFVEKIWEFIESDILPLENTGNEPESTENEDRKIFGYNFNFYDKNKEAMQLLYALQNVGVYSDFVSKPDFVNGLEFTYKDNDILIFDNSGEFKIDNKTTGNNLEPINFSDGAHKKQIPVIAREIIDTIDEDIEENEYKTTQANEAMQQVIESEVKPEPESEKFMLPQKNHRVFTVHKDGTPNTEFDNLNESEAEKIFDEQSKLPNSEIVTWDKAEYNEYGKLSGWPTVRIMTAHKKDVEPETTTPISEKPSDEGYDLVKKIRMIIDTNGTDREAYSPDELRLLRQYTGMGGYATRTDKGAVDTGLLDQFYTPYPVIEKMFGLAFKHGFSFEGSKRILEQSCGIGRFIEYIPKDQSVTAYEIDKYAYTIAKISFPEFEIFNEPFETMFFKGNRRIGLRNVEEKYDLVIGNPPYREFVSKYAIIEDASGQSEKSDTLALTFDQYMLMRGIDVLNPGGLLVFIVPSSFMANDKKYNNFKNQLAKKAELVDAYRLPQSTFPNTQITTDILVLKRK